MNVQDTPMNAGGLGTATGFDRETSTASIPRSIPGVCPTCGQSANVNSGLEQFLQPEGDLYGQTALSAGDVDVKLAHAAQAG